MRKEKKAGQEQPWQKLKRTTQQHIYKEVMKGIRKGKRDHNEKLTKQDEAAGQWH